MIAPIPEPLQRENDSGRIFSFSELFKKNNEDNIDDLEEGLQQQQAIIIDESERNRLVSENTKRVFTIKDSEGNSATRVLDCLTRQLFYEKQCESQDEFEHEKQNISILYGKFEEGLDNMVNVVRDIDEQEHRIYYENGIISFRQICEYQMKKNIYWFDQQAKLKNIFKSIFHILHKLFEESFFYGNISLDTIIFCRKQYGEQGLTPKLLDLGYGSFNFDEIIREYQDNKHSLIQNEEERKIYELQFLGNIFADIMYESILEYENNLLAVFKEISQKPESMAEKTNLEVNIAGKMEKIAQYYQNDLVQALEAIFMQKSYGDILDSIIALEIDEENYDQIQIQDEENQYHSFLVQKVQEIQISSYEELIAYLQILKSLDLWSYGVKIINENLENFPLKQYNSFLYEIFTFYQMAGQNFIPVVKQMSGYIADLKKDKKNKDLYFKQLIYTVFLEPELEKQQEIYTESVDHFQLADNPPTFAWILYTLGNIFAVLENEEISHQLLLKASQQYDSVNEESYEKAYCYQNLSNYLPQPQKKIQMLNKAFKVYKEFRTYEGQQYAKLMEQYGNAYKSIGVSENADDMLQSAKSPQLGSNTQIVDENVNEPNYRVISQFYQSSYEVYDFSLGKNNQQALQLKLKLCNVIKLTDNIPEFIKQSSQYLLLIQPEKDKELISDMTTLVQPQELEQLIQKYIVDQANIYERSNQFQEAQGLVEVAIKILLKIDKSTLLENLKNQLEILRLKHMYEETLKDFLLTEGYEKSISSGDKNYFFKRWNINLIVNNDLKTALKSIVKNLPNCEESYIDYCESLILVSCIYKKMEKFEKAEENIMRCKTLVDQYQIFYLQQYVKEQIEFIQFLAQQQIENKLDQNRQKYEKMVRKKSCQQHEMLRIQMNSAFLYEQQDQFKASKELVKEVLLTSQVTKNSSARRSASTTLNRLYEKKLMEQLEKQQNNKRPSTAF